MKKIFAFIVFSLIVFASGKTYSQMANVQLIHNSADSLLSTADVYVNGVAVPALQDVRFRTASAFFTMPAGFQLQVGIAPGNSSGANEIIKSFPITLESGKTYLAIVCGVADPAKFAANADPNAKPLALNCEIIGGKSVAQNANKVELLVFHGATDAPAVDILINDTKTTELSGLSYGKNSGYVSFDPATYTIGVAPAGGSVVGSFQADLSGEAGKAMVLVASGFLVPSINQNGAPFGLFSVSASGGNFTPLTVGTTGIDDEVKNNAMSVYSDYTGQTAVTTFSLPENSDISLNLYDMNGTLLMNTAKANLSQGIHTIQTDISTVPCGMYSLLLSTKNEIMTSKIFIIH